MMSDQFCLRWNNFQSNIVSALDSLKCSEDLVDVTLTCEGRNIKAHKVILSACSPYFRTVFKENPCQHPIIILKDVLADDIINLLSYMYQGEVFIEESKLSSFLHTAALLQVKGLTGATHHVRENMTSSSANVANKLYTQLTISHKEISSNTQRDIRIIPQYKRRRNSASDRLTDTTPNECSKRTRVCETFDEPLRLDVTASPPNDSGGKSDTESTNRLGDGSPKSVTGDDKNDPVNNHVKAPMQGKSSPQESSAVNIKSELSEPSNAASGTESTTGNSDSIDAGEAHPEYENSMLARSLLSGVHALKSDLNANISPPKSKPSKPAELQCLSKRESLAPNVPLKKIPLRSSPQMQEEHIKAEMLSPKSDIDYEPEVVISEQNDSLNTDLILTDDRQSSLILLTGLTSGTASTSQGISQAHAQANHAAICGDCPHCGMKYSNQSALKYHVRLMHSDLTNRLCCYLCPRSFTMREFFKEHMWNTHGQRN